MTDDVVKLTDPDKQELEQEPTKAHKYPWLMPYVFKKGNKASTVRKGKPQMKTLLKQALEADVMIKGTTKTRAEWIALSLTTKAVKGDVRAIKEIFERIDGKVAKVHHISGAEGGPIVSEHSQVVDPDQDILDRYYEERKRLEQNK